MECGQHVASSPRSLHVCVCVSAPRRCACRAQTTPPRVRPRLRPAARVKPKSSRRQLLLDPDPHERSLSPICGVGPTGVPTLGPAPNRTSTPELVPPAGGDGVAMQRIGELEQQLERLRQQISQIILSHTDTASLSASGEPGDATHCSWLDNMTPYDTRSQELCLILDACVASLVYVEAKTTDYIFRIFFFLCDSIYSIFLACMFCVT